MQQGMLSIYEAMAEQGEIVVKGSGDRIRNFIHVDDLVYGIMLAVNRFGGKPYEVINMGTGVPITVAEIVESFGCPYRYTDPTPYDIDVCNADMSKAFSLLGYLATDRVLSYISQRSHH
jgi:nucleoside-diphosphate-sugar epimerase